ncbi:MAG: M48 family metallopeptidase [Bacteroidaceae bacterium]|nr:M48 family metallopeptidase [Bacteroidaceae bacterium]
MKFDSEKWALTFYGVVDERFKSETDLFQLHIHRKEHINKLEKERCKGKLDIFIPRNWKMERYKYQEQLRRMLLSEIRWQANIIFSQRTMFYAKQYNIACERIELEARYRYLGKYFSEKKLVKYNPWIICAAPKRHVDYLVCHELSHFIHNDHSPAFWEMAERLYLGLDLKAPTSGHTIHQLRNELVQNKVLFLLMYWGRPSYLKSFFWNGLVKHKTPLIIPDYMESTDKRVKSGYYTTFAIRV